MAKSNDRGKYRIRNGAGRKIVIESLSRTDVGKFPLELQAEGILFSGISNRQIWKIMSRLRRLSSVIGIEYRIIHPVLEEVKYLGGTANQLFVPMGMKSFFCANIDEFRLVWLNNQ
jgi:hypothetical protein